MGISYSSTRNRGLCLLLLFILMEGVFSYAILNRQSGKIQQIVTYDEDLLRRWYDVNEIIQEAKDRLYDYQLGKIQSIAGIDLLLFKAIDEVATIRRENTNRDSFANIDDLLRGAHSFRDLLALHRQQKIGSSLVDENALLLANRMVLLARSEMSEINNGVERQHRQMLRQTVVYQRILVVGLIFSTLATAFIALSMIRALASPIRMLVAGTERLASGDLQYQVTVDSKDEIGKLATSFNRMATELDYSRNELLMAKSYTDNILRSMINALVVVDETGRIETINEATCTLLGYSRNELLGRAVADLFAEGYFERFAFDKFMGQISGMQQESVFLTREGTAIPMLLSGSVLRDSQRDVVGLVLVAQDITMQSEAVRAGHLASLGELAAGVAQEINNPLNSIINFAQILLDELHDDGQVRSEDILEKIISEGDRVSGIVRGLLSFSREEEKRREVIGVADIIQETLQFSESQLKKDGIHLSIDIQPGTHSFSGHFQQLQQVLLNVINNARYALNEKFPGKHPGKKLCITAMDRMSNNEIWTVLEIVDFGTGISEEVLKKIKNPFFSTKPTGKGTGLGLSISHGIMTDHGGQLLVDSVQGEWTKITLLLPVVQSPT